MNVMALTVDETIPTKTWRYLSFTLRHYGEEFLYHLNNVYCIMNGIDDHDLFKATGVVYDRHIFCLCNIDKKDFANSLEFFREHESYEWDYPVINPTLNLHMIVFKVPDKYITSIEFLKRSQYSQMYSKQQMRTLFYPDEKDYDFHKILTRDESYIQDFEDKVNNLSKDTEIASTRISLPEGAELDFNFKPEEEIFNYNKSLVGETP